MSAGVTTWGTPMSSSNWRRRGDADASLSTGCFSSSAIHPPYDHPFRTLFAVVGVILQHGMRAIQLFREDDAHHGMRKGQRRQRPAQAGLHEDAGPETVGTPDDEAELAAVLLALAQPPGELQGGEGFAALVERDQVVVTDALEQALFLVRLGPADGNFFQIDPHRAAQAARVFLVGRRDPLGHARTHREDANAHSRETSARGA